MREHSVGGLDIPEEGHICGRDMRLVRQSASLKPQKATGCWHIHSSAHWAYWILCSPESPQCLYKGQLIRHFRCLVRAWPSIYSLISVSVGCVHEYINVCSTITAAAYLDFSPDRAGNDLFPTLHDRCPNFLSTKVINCLAWHGIFCRTLIECPWFGNISTTLTLGSGGHFKGLKSHFCTFLQIYSGYPNGTWQGHC